MKVCKLAVALALAGGLGSGIAQALGLGEVQLQSYLNEPLDAQISLPQSRGVSSSDVFVNVAPESAYRRVGLSRDQFVSKLSFKVVTRSDGSLAVNISSREPLREPYLNFLLELTWPNGRLLREYAVLVDPPVYAAQTGAREPLVAASSGDGRSQAATGNNDSANRSSRPADSPGDQRTAGNVYGPTGASDTLWDIAAQMRPDNSVSMQQVMLAIQDVNPDAFISANINRLKRGEVLRVPTMAQIQRRNQGQAIQAVAVQNRDASSTRATIDATTAARAPSPPAAADDNGGELRLVVADTPATETETASATESERPQFGSAGADGSGTGGVDAGTAIALEQLESVRRENSELGARLDQLQEQVETLQRLLELKDSQLADIQQTGMDDGSPAAANPMPSEGGSSAANSVNDSKPTALQSEPVEEPEFMGGFFNSVMNNWIYQAVLGGGLLLLLLLLLLVSRRKNREQEVLEDDVPVPEPTPDYVAADTGSFDLALDDPAPTMDDTNHDVLTEVDSYLAYGQHEQAINALESAISREPSRTELRLKLLAVYADAEDRMAFERQYGELSALEDDEAMEEADRLLENLEQAEAAPSIDDLESELRSGSRSGSFAGSFAEPFAASEEDSNDDLDSKGSARQESKAHRSINYDLTGINDAQDTDELEQTQDAAGFEDFVLSEDFAREFADDTTVPLSKRHADKVADDDSLSLDESFLDELDAELDKDVDDLPEMTDAELQMLELGDGPESEIEALEELGFGDLDDDDGISLEHLDTLELPEEDLSAYELAEDDLIDEGLPLAPDEFLGSAGTPKPAADTAPMIDESELGEDDDDFDFLAGTDEAATKLDLARAYVEMGDAEGARDILQEVELEGTVDQKAEAKELLKNLP